MKTLTHFQGASVLMSGAPFLIFLVLLVSACSNSPPQPAGSPEEALYQRGKSVYMAQCIACHSANPAKEGAIGPAVQGASPELLRARLLSAGYPEGYVPKRPTNAMPAMPHLSQNIDALAKFLSNP